MLYRKLFFLALILTMSLHAGAQMIRFNKSFGGPGEDQGRSVKQTRDKGYIVASASATYSFGGMDIWMIKTDSMGMHEWSKNFGGLNSEWPSSVEQLPDSGYIVAGYTNSFGNGGYDMYLLRLDKSGNELWSRTYGGTDWDFAYALRATADGGFILAGSTGSYGAGNDDVYLVKTDANGDTLWTKTYGGLLDDVAQSVWQNNDGGYFFSGYTNSFGNGGHDVYYSRTDAAGIPMWTKTLGGPRDEESFSGIQCLLDGGFLMVGYTKSFFSTDSTEVGYLIKTTFTGDTIFTYEVCPSIAGYSSRIYSIVETPDYDLAMAGWTEFLGKKDMYFFKSDPYYAYINATTHGYYEEHDAAYSMSSCTDGGYILAGSTESFGQGLNDVYIVKTDTIGYTATYNFISIPAAPGGKLMVVPNPVTGEARINLPGGMNSNSLELTITDITGRTVKKIVTVSTGSGITFNRDQLSPGIYYFTILDKDESAIIGTGKMIVL